jgi:acyl-CoA thioester hydrolase
MARVYTWEFDVRSYELDADQHVNRAVYNNYLEESATRASADAGYDHQWYFDQRRAWVVRELTLRYLHPLVHGDRVRARTWVSDFRRIYSHREYDLRRAADDLPVFRGRAKWVYVNLDTMRPERIPAAFESAFDPTPEPDPLDITLADAVTLTDSPSLTSTRRVQHYEVDPAGHVNNAVYVNWFEQAYHDALTAAGWPVDRLRADGLTPVWIGHRIGYLRPTMAGMALTMTSQPVAQNADQWVWQHTIQAADTGDVIAEDYMVGAFCALPTRQACPLPERVLSDVLATRSA